MDASDDGMCKGWRDQIDTLIIFAGLFSATVTAFTVESYQWLNETPADTLARLQLRDLLNTTHDPAIDRLAPASFHVSSASVVINTLWFASLTLSLAAVVISILCKQWLYEYQRYDNFTTDEALLIHGLRYQGLQAWRVPAIISSLPILLQTALVLFLIGILALLWPLQIIVVSITTTIVGLTFLFLGITTALPSIQYIFPIFDTQCAYKSSQSWSFLLVSAFWRFDFGEFTSWAPFDRWEVTCVYNDMGQTLSRVYKLLGNNADVVLSIYSVLAEKSLKPTIKADLALLPNFLNGLDALGKQVMGRMSGPIDANYEVLQKLRRIKQLKTRLSNSNHRRLKPGIGYYYPSSSYGTSKFEDNVDGAYCSRVHQTLNEFLRKTGHVSHPAFFNRYVEHRIRAPDASYNIKDDGTALPPSAIYFANTPLDPEVAVYLVKLHAHLFQKDQLSLFRIARLLSNVYLGLLESYRQHEFDPAPVTLLEDIQEWVNRVPESDLPKKVRYAEYVLFSLAFKDDFLRKLSESHTSDMEKERLDIRWDLPPHGRWHSFANMWIKTRLLQPVEKISVIFTIQ
ncbi:hypothetical protein BDZ94DRAFT_966564 [Collybia nuda]|uniref:DUF6535 domain-containing protein n=1 Tax=Collybia nuda TaxID=64659 RepID=A0A9P5YCJ2_9AGAR|nr:hypothetical protein BDZ94DRAFT_966564 [Collybia nuda]